MIKKYLGLLILTLVLVTGSGAAHAITDVTPADSAINPSNQAVYMVENDSSPRLKVFTKSSGSWNSPSAVTLPAKCYGLAVTPDGNKLYASINNGASSAIRRYNLDGSGVPGATTDISGLYFTYASSSSPAGLAVGGNNRLFMADKGMGRVLIFNTSTDSYVKAITDQLAGKSNIYGVAVTSTSASSYKIYVSRKISAGEIYVYDYSSSGDTVTYVKKLTGISYPTYMQVVGNKLFVAINGTNGEDVKVYSTSNESVIGTVKSGVTGSYGWNAFDVTSDGSYLFLKKASNSTETSNKIYRQKVSDISGTVTASEVTGTGTINRNDGIRVSFDKTKAVLSDSPDGSYQIITIDTGEAPPAIVADFDATDGEDSQSVLTWTNPSDTDLDQVIVVRNTGTWPSIDSNGNATAGTIVHSNSGVAPGSAGNYTNTGLTNFTTYYYAVFCNDSDGNWNTTLDDTKNADMGIPSDTTPCDTITDFDATDGEDGQSTLTWTNPSNLDLAQVIVVRNEGTWPAINSSGVVTAGTQVYLENSGAEGTSQSYTDTGLTNGTTYYYAAFSRDIYANWNTTVDYTPASVNADTGTPSVGADAIAPAAIDDLSAAIGSGLGEVNLTWTAPADDGSNASSGAASGYIIYYQYSDTKPADASSAMVYTPSPTPGTPGTTENLTLTGLTPGEKVWLMMKAYDEVPNVSADGNWAVTIVKNFVPAPTITKIYPQKAPNNIVNHIVIEGTNLYNDMLAYIVSYDGTSVSVALTNVHQDSDTMVQADIPIDSALVVGTYEVTITCPGGTYDDASHTNPNNDFTMITPGSDTTAPALVADFDASDGENAQSTLTWTNPSDIDLREVMVLRKTGTYPSSHTDGSASLVYQTSIPEPGASISYVDTGLTNGVTYYYAVFSKDTSSNWNDTVTAASNADTGTPNISTVDTTPPAAITDLSAAVGSASGSIDLTWTAPGDDGTSGGSATSYTIYYQYSVNKPSDTSSASTYSSPPTPGTPGAAETLTMTGLTPGEKVWIMITADDEVPNTSADGNWAVTIVKNYVPAPTIDYIYPDKGPNNAAHHIVIRGSNLYNSMIANIVSYDGTSVNVLLQNVQQNSSAADPSTFVEADIPLDSALVAGTYEVTITCPGGSYTDASHTNPNNDFEMIGPGTDTTPPALITNFNASDSEDAQSTLTWTNPSDGDLRQVRVLRRVGSYPTGYNDLGAINVYETSIPSPGASVSYADTGLTNGTTYYYAVFSKDTSNNWQNTVTAGSNADTATPSTGSTTNPAVSLTYNATGGNIFWISVPYNTPYTTASDIIADINTQNAEASDSGNIITSIGRWDGTSNPQVYETYDYLGVLGWSGTDFNIVTGESIYLNIAADTTFTLQGSHDPTFIFNLPYDSARGNVFWVSLPYEGDFTDAASIIADLNTSAGEAVDSGNIITSIGRWDGATQAYESYDYLGLLGWSGTNFGYVTVEGYYVNIAADVTTWSPSTH